MKARCYDPKDINYPRYGAKGIRVDPAWINDFEQFYADMGPMPSEHHTLDRIDPDGDYAPENVRWVTREENASRKRTVTQRGEDHKLSKLTEDKVREIRASPLGSWRLAKQYGVSKKLILNIRHGRTWKHVT